MSDDRFSACLPFILKEEGGNSDNPHDPGGRTSRGIIQREYNSYRSHKGLPVQDVYRASDAEVADIYQQQYWLPWCPQMPAGVDLCFFDMAVNSGPVEAAKLLQRALGITADGHVGTVTIGALTAANPIRLITAYSDERSAFYRSLATFKYFGAGWLSRVKTIEAAALKMAASATPASAPQTLPAAEPQSPTALSSQADAQRAARAPMTVNDVLGRLRSLVAEIDAMRGVA